MVSDSVAVTVTASSHPGWQLIPGQVPHVPEIYTAVRSLDASVENDHPLLTITIWLLVYQTVLPVIGLSVEVRVMIVKNETIHSQLQQSLQLDCEHTMPNDMCALPWTLLPTDALKLIRARTAFSNLYHDISSRSQD